MNNSFPTGLPQQEFLCKILFLCAVLSCDGSILALLWTSQRQDQPSQEAEGFAAKLGELNLLYCDGSC